MAGIKCVLNVPLLRVIKPGFKDDVPSSLTLPLPIPPFLEEEFLLILLIPPFVRYTRIILHRIGY